MLTALAACKFLGHYNSYWQDLLLFISAIMTALLTFWRPGEKADRYRAAWALLGNQIDRYDAHEVNAESVRRVCEYCEAMVRFTSPIAMPGAVKSRER